MMILVASSEEMCFSFKDVKSLGVMEKVEEWRPAEKLGPPALFGEGCQDSLYQHPTSQVNTCHFQVSKSHQRGPVGGW